MNYIKWLVCWWSKTHIFAHYIDRHGKSKNRCIRCGVEK